MALGKWSSHYESTHGEEEVEVNGTWAQRSQGWSNQRWNYWNSQWGVKDYIYVSWSSSYHSTALFLSSLWAKIIWVGIKTCRGRCKRRRWSSDMLKQPYRYVRGKIWCRSNGDKRQHHDITFTKFPVDSLKRKWLKTLIRHPVEIRLTTH